MSIEYEQSNINGIMAMYHECGQESAADDVISCHFLLTSNLVTSNYSTALNCQTNKQRAEQTKRIYKEQFARIAYFSALNYGTFNRSHLAASLREAPVFLGSFPNPLTHPHEDLGNHSINLSC